ncbi:MULTISPECIES: hypothetical protein [Streptomyces]|uniref:hypothetical protein n=1 Tax=Streptomyces TaxID=1883 RepID=UPI001160EC6A|nr:MULTISPECIES: hypothetical protein [Streptomyces]MBX9424843.1 hypothetical protein [Streptomyces lateritius]
MGTMRTRNRFAKIVLAAALAGMALTACGTADPSGRTTAGASAVEPGAKPKPKPTPTPVRSLPSDALAEHPDPEMRFLALSSRVLDGCVPGGLPQPPSVPPEDVPPPQNLPGRPMPEEPGDLSVPSGAPEPPPAPEPAPTRSGPVEEVPLTAVDKCAGDAHAARVRTAFDGAGPADYPALKKKLTSLDYPPSRIHRMPDHGGAPRARIDLRFMGGNLALEVTGTPDQVLVEPFGAPETEDVRVTDVKRKP